MAEYYDVASRDLIIGTDKNWLMLPGLPDPVAEKYEFLVVVFDAILEGRRINKSRIEFNDRIAGHNSFCVCRQFVNRQLHRTRRATQSVARSSLVSLICRHRRGYIGEEIFARQLSPSPSHR